MSGLPFPALFKPPLPWCYRWDFHWAEKGNSGSGLCTAEVCCVTAPESLCLTECPFRERGWRGQSGLQGPVQLLSL